MGLTLVLGPANSAKAGEVLGAFAAAAPRGALLVVPTAADAGHYARELAGDTVVLGSVVTFSGLVAEIARRARYTARRLSSLQRRRVLQGVVENGRLDVLRESAAAGGFADAAGDLIAELTRGLVTPERLIVALRAWSAEDVRRAPYATEVGRLYSAYGRELERLQRVDDDLYAWRAIDALRAQPGRWGTDPVFVYGFDDLTALERDVVETLARVAGTEVTVSLTYEPGREALVARAETVEELRPLAQRVLELPAQDTYYAPPSRAALHHLERGLFEPGLRPEDRLDPGDAVTLLEAGGERAEAELVAQRTLALLRDGVAPDEIAVVHRSLASAGPLLTRVFAAYGVPLAARHTPPVAHTTLGRGLIAAARCALTPDVASADDLLTYLRTPGVLQTPEIADGLDADVRRGGLRTAAQARERLGWELPELEEFAAARDAGRALCRLAQRLLAAPHRQTATIFSDAETLDARALRAVIGAIDELAELRLTPPPAELIRLLAEQPIAPEAGSAGESGAVLLAEPLQIRARRFRVVFVCGLQEGEFPRPASPEPFFSDERRRELAMASGLRLRRREDALAAERYLLYASLSRATERVYLAYRSSDEEGNLALPSPFITDVAELMDEGWRGRRGRRLLADVVWSEADAPTARERRRARAARDAAAAGEEAPPRRVLGEAAMSRVRHTQVLSAGALETYAACPVKWLIDRELQPESLTPESEPITRGNIMHGVLEQLMRTLDAPLTPATLQRAQMILTQLLDEAGPEALESLAPGSPEVMRAGALRAIEADLRRYLEHEARTGAGWRPWGVEVRFGFEPGEKPSLPPLALGDGETQVLVRGMVDRVDVDGAGHAVVRDYKSGAKHQEWSSARWSSDRQLQVALYMLVVRELAGLDPVAGVYQPLRGEDLRARGVFTKGADLARGQVPTDGRSAEEIDALLDDAAQRAVALATALRAGELTPCPSTCSRDGCLFPAICRSQ